MTAALALVVAGSRRRFPPTFGSETALFTMTLEGTTSAPSGTNAIYTFAQGFKKGDVPAGTTLLFRSSGPTDLRTQVDWKTTYDDGSLEHALMAVEKPLIADGATLAITLYTNAVHSSPGSTIDLAAALASGGRTAVVGVDPEGAGAEWTYDLVANLPASTRWRSGPLVSEARIEVAIPSDKMGSATASPASNSTGGRLVADLWLTKDGQLFVDAIIANDSFTWPESTGKDAKFAARLTIDGTNVATMTERVITTYSRTWLFGGIRSGAAVSWYPVWLRPPSAYLASAGWCLPYDLTNTTAEATLASYATSYGRSTWNDGYPSSGVTENRDLSFYVGATGDRPEIGFLTEAGSAWIAGGQSVKRAEKYACDQADLLQSYTIFNWDKARARWASKNDVAFWPDNRWVDYIPPIGTSVWTNDVSHYPAAHIAPYLLRGRRSHLDLIEAGASFSISHLYDNAVGGIANYAANTGIRFFVAQDQRACAWCMRNVLAAMRMAPSSGPNGTYWRDIVDSNMNWVDTTRVSIATAQGATALSEWWDTNSDAIAPWQGVYIAQVLWAIAKRGEHPKAQSFLLALNAFYAEQMVATHYKAGKENTAAAGSDWPQNFSYYIHNRTPGAGPPYVSWLTTYAAIDAVNPPFAGTYGWDGDLVNSQLTRLRFELVRDLVGVNATNDTARTTMATSFNATYASPATRATYPKMNVLAT